MATVTRVPEPGTTTSVLPAILPVPFHFLATGLLVAALGGVDRFAQSFVEAGPIVYLALLAAFVAAIINTVLLVKAARGGSIPAFLPLALALSPWLLGIIGTILGMRNVTEAVEMVNPEDKATILAAGLSEALNNRLLGGWYASAQLAAVGIGLGAIAWGRAGAAKNQSAAPIAGVALFCAIAAVAASRWIGMPAALPMIIPCIALALAFYLAGSGATGSSEENVSIVASGALSAAAAVAAMSVACLSMATSRLLYAIDRIEPEDKRRVLEVGMDDAGTAQLVHAVALLFAFGGAIALSVMAQRRAAPHQPAPKAVAIPAAFVVAVLAVTFLTQGQLGMQQILDAW